MTNPATDLAFHLRTEREARGETLEQFGKHIGAKKNWIYRAENPSKYSRAEQVLGIRLADLLEELILTFGRPEDGPTQLSDVLDAIDRLAHYGPAQKRLLSYIVRGADLALRDAFTESLHREESVLAPYEESRP